MLNLLKKTMADILRKQIRSPSARSHSSAGSDPKSPEEEDDGGYNNARVAQKSNILSKYFED
jgi:hypothetical protein